MDKLGKCDKIYNIFEIAKFRFPHIDFQTLNPQLSFSQNLDNIIMQLGLPTSAFEVNHQISNMKQAVDRQELKIQTSLVNDENVDMTNRNHRKISAKASEQIQNEMSDAYEQADYQSLVLKPAMTRNHQYQSQQIIEQIWMFDSVVANGEGNWFQN